MRKLLKEITKLVRINPLLFTRTEVELVYKLKPTNQKGSKGAK